MSLTYSNLPIPAALAQALTQAADQGQGRSQRLAIVGGAVRDLLLHRVHRDPWRGLLDLAREAAERRASS